MIEASSASLADYFADLTDPRRREGTYPLVNFLVIGICAVICGADDFVAMAEFGRVKRKFLELFLDLSAGIPSHDRFNAIFAAMKPAEFEKCLLNWITALHEVTSGQVIAIDGKTLRGSYDQASSKSAIHMVSAWATANHISLGQTVVDQKSNEITAIPPTAENPRIVGLFGDDRRGGMPGQNRPGDRRCSGRLRVGGQRKPEVASQQHDPLLPRPSKR
jgi:hypothetical protein